MLCRMAFQLSGKVVTLQLDNNIAKAYLCNPGGKVSLSLQTCLLHIKSCQQAWHHFNSSIHSFSSQCGSLLSFMGKVGARVAPSLPIPGSLSAMESTGGGSVGFLIYQ